MLLSLWVAGLIPPETYAKGLENYKAIRQLAANNMFKATPMVYYQKYLGYG